MKKLLNLAFAGLVTLSLSACGASGAKTAAEETTAALAETTAQTEETGSKGAIAKEDVKAGFIFIGDENEGYTAAHYEGAMQMKEALDLSDDQVIIKWNIPEDETCKDAAMDLADQGCNIVFANSFGHESYLLEAAKEYPDVQFCHATGYQAALSGLANMHNYFTNVYESRYVSGVVAGLKLNQMLEEGTVAKDAVKIGYVGAYPYAEVISGYTSFFLGIRSVCPEAVMEVKYTNSWGSFALEKEAADALISNGCVLISQHADTTGAPTACEEAGVPVVGYNISMIATAPKAALTSAAISWGPYVTYAVQSLVDGSPIATDWCQGYKEGANSITELNVSAVATGTEEKVKETEDALKAGTLKVFDTSAFTVGGKTLETYKKDGSEVEYISGGYFHESEYASAPAFDLLIDGITTVDN